MCDKGDALVDSRFPKMASAATIVGILLIVGLIGVGISQEFLAHAPGATLAGAVTAPQEPAAAQPTQQQLNICMNDCMHECVKQRGDEPPCIEKCNPQCGA